MSDYADDSVGDCDDELVSDGEVEEEDTEIYEDTGEDNEDEEVLEGKGEEAPEEDIDNATAEAVGDAVGEMATLAMKKAVKGSVSPSKASVSKSKVAPSARPKTGTMSAKARKQEDHKQKENTLKGNGKVSVKAKSGTATKKKKQKKEEEEEKPNTCNGNDSAIVKPLFTSIDDVLGKDWYFWNLTGASYMGGGATNPVLQKRESSKFCIVPVGARDTRGRQKVAIMYTNPDRSKPPCYISCRRKSWVSNSSLAEYRSTIGAFETFTISYCEADQTFLFQAHNMFYLHYNETFHTVAFKTCSDRNKEDGFPVKGRWVLLDVVDRAGTKCVAAAVGAMPLKALNVAAGAVATGAFLLMS